MDETAERVAIERIVLERERVILTGVKRSSWYELEAADLAPHRRQLVGKRTGWLLSELVAWIKARPVANNVAPAGALRARGITSPQAAA